MKILYDHQIFTLQKYGGISRYFYELMKKFKTMNGVSFKTALYVSNNYYIEDKHLIKHVRFLPNTEFKGKKKLMSLINKPKTLFELKRQNYDIFHVTYYDPYFLDYIGSKPFVLTVHDMIHEKFQEMGPSEENIIDYKSLLVKKASKIIAVSESTKKDLIEYFGTDASKIEVVYHGSSMLPKRGIHIDTPTKYILFVGLRGGYKNFNRFIRSISTLLLDDRELSVVCVGGGRFNLDEIEAFEYLGITSQLSQFDLNDDALAYMYQNASLFVFPSLYEGFGIPILEAYACECPLVCSNTSALPEIAGNGAYYFDPYSEESMKNAISRVLNDPDIQKTLVLEGTERLQHFSWEKAAFETQQVYESLL
ncbi:glycosyltransferase family 4 protein [Sulfurovum sp.]|uniref:glycosyltransferase family 4 protein n=1 Tax=Sulfurovum sp. TaxID=1969726 RepID=UPI0035687E15